LRTAVLVGGLDMVS